GFWHPHTFVQSLAFVPAGALVVPIGVLMVRPLALPFPPIAAALLNAQPAPMVSPRPRGRSHPTVRPRYALETHAAVDGIVVFALVVIWVLTSAGYFWPIWVILPLASALGIHGWLVLIDEEHAIVRRFRNSRALAASAGISGVLAAY